MKASVRLDHSFLAVEAEHSVYCLLEVDVPEEGRAERVPLNLAVVIDRSGSMAGDKLETTKACVEFLVRRLAADDRISIVDYDEQVRLLSPLAPAAPDALAAAVHAIQAGGSTNLSGGWLKGVEELRRVPDAALRKVLLLTDGLANVGVTSTDALVGMAGSARSEGIGTSTIGFGDGFAEDLLTGMAEAAGGNAYYAATVEEAPAIFASELEGLVALAAQNVSVEIRPEADVEVVSILNEYPSVAVEGGVQVALGDAYSGERRKVVFQLHVPHLGRLGPAKIAALVMRYVSVGDEIAAHEVSIPIVVNLVSADEAAAAGLDAEVTEQVTILVAARARREAVQLADGGDYDGARRVLEAARQSLAARVAQSPLADDLLGHIAELDASAATLAAGSYTAQTRKQLWYQAHQTQRGQRDRKRKPDA